MKNKQQLYLFIEFLSIHSRRRVYILSRSYVISIEKAELKSTSKRKHKNESEENHTKKNQILLLNFEIKNNEIKEKTSGILVLQHYGTALVFYYRRFLYKTRMWNTMKFVTLHVNCICVALVVFA